MAKWYSSFLVRWWHLDTGGQRIEIEHIQTGERTVLDALPDALAWLEARSAGEADGPPPAPHAARPSSPEEGRAGSLSRESGPRQPA